MTLAKQGSYGIRVPEGDESTTDREYLARIAGHLKSIRTTVFFIGCLVGAFALAAAVMLIQRL
jgi:hypothetical protein